MHSSDRTLIAQLGFADPDKKDPRHDLACQYLANLAVTDALADLITEAAEAYRVPLGLSPIHGWSRSWEYDQIRDVRIEDPIYRGERQYRSTVGFADVVAKCHFRIRDVCEREDMNAKIGQVETYFIHAFVAFEVKIKPVTLGDALRQINFYRGYLPPSWIWVLATAYPLPPHEVETLYQAGIAHCLLGHGFQHWCAEIGALSDGGRKSFQF